MENAIVIRNPKIFCSEKYIQSKLLIDEFSEGKVVIFNHNEVPYEIIISFSSQELCDKFIEKFNNNPIDENLDYNLIVEKFSGELEKEKETIANSEEKLTKRVFYYDYEKMYATEYLNTPDDPGLVFLNEEEKVKIDRAIKWLLNKLGSNILAGHSIMTISLPVFLFDPRTMHETFCYDNSLAPFALSRAALATDNFERLKWVTTYAISQLHISTIESKPFNPILGETYQCRIGNLNMYVEHTRNHPNTANFYAFDDDKSYTIQGYLVVSALTGTNSVTGIKKGPYDIVFKDGSKYTVHLPAYVIKGLLYGKRMANHTQVLLVVDHTNKYCSYVVMNPDEAGFLKSWFSSKQPNTPDTFRGQIVKLEDVTISEKDCTHKLKSGATSFCKITGAWTKELLFDDEVYWEMDEYQCLSKYEIGYMLPSDGRKRMDLIKLIDRDEEQSQIEKEKLEVLQRKDRKLRADWLKSQKNNK